MSHSASVWVWGLPLPRSLKLVALAIADACNSEGFGYPGQERIARMVGCSQRQIVRDIAKLVAQGVLEKQIRPGEGCGRK